MFVPFRISSRIVRKFVLDFNNRYKVFSLYFFLFLKKQLFYIMKKIIIPALVAMTLIACDSNKSNQVEKENIKLKYPETRKGDQVDTYFGVDINDPYRWLEDDMSEETKEWVKAQNEVT